MDGQRPKRRPAPRFCDRVLNVLSVLCLLVGFVLVIVYLPQLPDRIPTHFNAAVEADGWGSRGMIWLLPAIIIVLVPGMLVLQRFPWLANVPFRINESNADIQYALIVRLLALLSLSVSLIFLLLLIETIAVAMGGKGPLGGWMLPVLILPTIGSLGWYLFAMIRNPGEPSPSDSVDDDQLSSNA